MVASPVQSLKSLGAPSSACFGVRPFEETLGNPLTKHPVSVLQINLGRRCNLSCTHCHVEAGPHRTEELSPEVLAQLLAMLDCFPQIQTVDLTGGAPEMNYGFRPLVARSRQLGKEIIVRSNLTIFFEPGFEDLPEYLAHHGARVVASLPCYLSDNVDKMRGRGVYDRSIQALQRLNTLGYGQAPDRILDLVYNPPVPTSDNFKLTPSQIGLEADYKAYLAPYSQFLAANHNPATVSELMCRNELSIDYEGNVYDCDFNQMAGVPAQLPDGTPVTVATLLALGSLDAIATVQTRPHCYGCTAGSGSSCGGALSYGIGEIGE
jgi:MoaA/NifB/PqqE/SkfB family radical SAM enzyme